MIWSSPCKRAISYGPYVNVGRLIWVCQIFENAQNIRFLLSVSAAVFLFLPPCLQEHELHDNWTWGWLSQSPNLQHYLTTRITIIIPTRGIKLPLICSRVICGQADTTCGSTSLRNIFNKNSVGPRHGVGAGYATLFVGILKEDFWLMAPMAFVLVTLAEKGGEGI